MSICSLFNKKNICEILACQYMRINVFNFRQFLLTIQKEVYTVRTVKHISYLG